ncbi:induced myeloid leukemia cell differentiation protein Mcl-1 homolog [Amblyraja radiata]|uniref:induced myeloid leukemia cell differentiation protein Mcl-1 homolog n=1 Tax=Amblyraja radiata TaxID=386614 RepID=UPI0014027C3A|nr:induced myeloid leukemia cell differentiation protein Mcl-1 homolog [Amblyraja radiata]
MDMSLMALNRSSTSTMLQLQNQLFSMGTAQGGGAAASSTSSTSSWAVRDNSLPQTPDETEMEEAPSFPDDLYRLTLSLVEGYIRYYSGGAGEVTGRGWLAWAPHKDGDERRAVETMQRVGDRLIEKHYTAFNGMINRLNNSNGCNLASISGVAAEVFSDGEVNWGRVVSLVAFGAVLATHLKKQRSEDCVEEVATQITQYLTKETREWLETHGGWDGFTKFFQENNSEECTKKALMWIAGVGLAGASIMHLLR